jgi:type I restriction enzyme S subunit
MIYKKIGELCRSYKKGIKPVNDEVYTLFSLPAFDNNEHPEIVNGSEIKSNKLAVTNNMILFNKLNVKYRRVWNIKTISTKNNLCSTEFIPLIANDGIDQDYLYYCLISDDVTYAMHAARKGTSNSQQRIDESILFSHSIPVPDLEVQKKIASLLGSIDDKIRINKQINDNLLQQCVTLYDEICSTAEIALMSDLVAIVETGSRPKGGAQTSGIPSIGAEKIERFGTYDYSGEKFISEEYFSKLKRGIITSGDVLLYKDGAYTGKSSMALDGFPHVKCAVNEHVFIIRTLNKKYQYFLYFTLQNDDIRKMIHGLACGKAAQPGLNQPELLSVSIKLPPKDVLEDFEEQVNPLMHQIALNALESKHLSALQDAILPKLMSGEIDVSSIELD